MTPPPPPEVLLAELERMTPALRRQLRGLLRDPSRIDDVLQEARVRAWSRPPARVSNPAGWLRVVVANLARQAHREDTRRRRREQRAARPDRMPPPASDLERREQIDRLVAAIEVLPEPERTTVIERYLERLGAEAIAVRHAVSRATVDRRLDRARSLLRVQVDGTRPARPGRFAWLPLGVWRGRDASAGAVVGGGVAMGLKTVVIAIAAAAVGYASGWVVRGAVDDDPAVVVEHTAVPHAEPEGPRLAPAPPTDTPVRTPNADTPARVSPAPATTTATTGDAALDAEAWLALINAADTDNHAYRIVGRLVELGPERSRDILVEIVHRIEPPRRTRTCLEPLCEIGNEIHPYAVDLLRVLVHDRDLETQNHALRLASELAWTDMSTDVKAFDAWCAARAGVPSAVVLAGTVRDWAERVERANAQTLEALLGERRERIVERLQRSQVLDLTPAARATRLPILVRRWWRDPSLGSRARSSALAWALLLSTGSSEAETENLFDALADVLRNPAGHDSSIISSAADALVERNAEGTLDLLLDAFPQVPRTLDWWDLARQVARLKDARAIPTLIGIIEAHDAYHSVYGVGYFGLRELTGVPYDESHDGAWWRDWWEKNRQRFAPEVAALDIPRLSPVAR